MHRGTWHGTEVALKVIKPMSSEQVFVKEAKIMRQLRHPNIVQFMGVCLEKPDLCIITEFLERGSLFDILVDPSYLIEEEHIRGVRTRNSFHYSRRQFALDCSRGMAYLHACHIIHRDLKCHNLLVDKYWRVKGVVAK